MLQSSAGNLKKKNICAPFPSPSPRNTRLTGSSLSSVSDIGCTSTSGLANTDTSSVADALVAKGRTKVPFLLLRLAESTGARLARSELET